MSAANEGSFSSSGPLQADTSAAQLLLVGGDEQRHIAPELHDSISPELAVFGQVVARMTHELNNVLTVIMGYADLALHKRLPSETNSEDLVQIKKASERAASLVRYLLAFSGPTGEHNQSHHVA